MDNLPLVSIIILCYNRKKEVLITLDKIINNLEYPKDKLEYLLIDNASTDGTISEVEKIFSQVKIIKNKKNFGTSGWNYGFEQANGEYFLVLDDDGYLEGKTLINLVEKTIQEDADLTSLNIINPDNKDSFDFIYPVGLLSFWGCGLLLKKTAFQKIGGFDPNIFIWCHELEYNIRMLNNGLKRLILPEEIGYHMKDTRAQISKQKAAFGFKFNMRNLFYIANKFFSGYRLWIINFRLFFRLLIFMILNPHTISNIFFELEGIGLGQKNKVTAKKEIQKIYLENFVEFQCPLKLIWIALKNPKRIGGFLKYHNLVSFYNSRKGFYPDQLKTLKI